MSTAAPLAYAARGAGYLRQAGRTEDEHRMLADQVTGRQRRRMFHKERRSWGAWADAHPATGWDCDVCGLPDLHRGNGDGIGSCDCPRCECGAAAHSQFCTCEPEGDYPDDYDDEAAAAEAERRFLGDLDGWTPTGVLNANSGAHG